MIIYRGLYLIFMEKLCFHNIMFKIGGLWIYFTRNIYGLNLVFIKKLTYVFYQSGSPIRYQIIEINI